MSDHPSTCPDCGGPVSIDADRGDWATCDDCGAIVTVLDSGV